LWETAAGRTFGCATVAASGTPATSVATFAVPGTTVAAFAASGIPATSFAAFAGIGAILHFLASLLHKGSHFRSFSVVKNAIAIGVEAFYHAGSTLGEICRWIALPAWPATKAAEVATAAGRHIAK
jgi:hypothetical protein